jgi:hypothetical protein
MSCGLSQMSLRPLGSAPCRLVFIVFSAERDGNRVARVPKARTPCGEIVVRLSDYSLKRLSLTGLAETDVSAVGKTAESGAMLL